MLNFIEYYLYEYFVVTDCIALVLLLRTLTLSPMFNVEYMIQ